MHPPPCRNVRHPTNQGRLLVPASSLRSQAHLISEHEKGLEEVRGESSSRSTLLRTTHRSVFPAHVVCDTQHQFGAGRGTARNLTQVGFGSK